MLLGLLVTLSTALPGGASPATLKLSAPHGYLPQVPMLVRVEALTADGERDLTLWDAEANLSVDAPSVTLSTNRVVLRNGMGSALVVFSDGGDFTLNASMDTLTASRPVVSLTNVAVTRIGGVLPSVNTSWSGVVRVTNTVTVPSGYTLTIASNTIVMINGVASGTTGAGLVINGAVQSLGTEDYPITITSSDRTLRWGQIRHNNAQPSLYRHTSIIWGGRAPGEGHTGQAPVLRPSNSRLVFENCNLTDYAETTRGATGYGTPGKVMQGSGSDVTFNNCILGRARMGPEIAGTALLVTNSLIADMYGPDDGDGIYIHAQSGGQQCQLIDSVIGNGDDDGIDTLDSSVVVERCIIRSWNNLFEDAKGISVFNGLTQVRQSLIVDCTVGISTKTTSSSTSARVGLDRCTMWGNGTNLLAQYKPPGAVGFTIDYRITNCILWSAAVASDFALTNYSIGYSDLPSAWTGTGNISADPLLANPSGHDYRLVANSPCINSGDPASPLDPDGSTADMGAMAFDSDQSDGLFVSITNPPAGVIYIGPTNVLIEASATSTTGTVAKVEFLEGAVKLGEAVTPPYSYLWSDVALGTYQIRAVATDNGGLTATSAPVSVTVASAEGPTTNIFIAPASTWAYLDDGSNQGGEWTGRTFDDSGWATGTAPLGYCVGTSCSYTFATVVGYGPNANAKYVTTYFRRHFVVEDPSRVESLSINLLQDDGAIVYINGEEVLRTNMPQGAVYNTNYASTAANYSAFVSTLPGNAITALVPGTNVVAVEVHQGNATSSDVVMELQLTGMIAPPTNQAPFVVFTSPINDLTVAPPGSFELAATASDIDGAVTNVAFYANTQKLGDAQEPPYTWQWEGVTAGVYDLTAVATDDVGQSTTSGVVRVIVSSDVAAPLVSAKNPAPGTVTNLTEVAVTFSKAVTGVNATDLLVNGSPATGVVGSGSNYVFSVAMPEYGLVTITWNAAHGITDLFTPPHAFDSTGTGATWSYQLVDRKAPSIATVTPIPNVTVSALKSVAVSFSEPVTGIDASDLLVNSVPATTVEGSGAGPYIFGFAQPQNGTVVVSWAGGHQIQDSSRQPLHWFSMVLHARHHGGGGGHQRSHVSPRFGGSARGIH